MTRLKRGLLAGGAALVLAMGSPAAAQDASPPTEAQPTAPPDSDGLSEAPQDGAAVQATPPPVEAAPPEPAKAAGFGSPGDAILAGKLLFEVRGRYEAVDQKRTATLTENGEAATVRTRLGWETGDWHGLKGLVEFEDVRQVGPEHFQVQVPGAAGAPINGAAKARYPIINDPDGTELNRLQLTWTPNAMIQATIGRQRILIDDQRFIGNVGWRQDEQTFSTSGPDGSATSRSRATGRAVSPPPSPPPTRSRAGPTPSSSRWAGTRASSTGSRTSTRR